MSDQSFLAKNVTNESSEAPLDLRAPVFAQIRKGLWGLRLITLVSVDYALLFCTWVLVEYHSSLRNFPWDLPNIFLSLLIPISIQIGALALQDVYRAGQNRYDYLNLIKALTFAHGLILLVCVLVIPIVDIERSKLIFSWLISVCLICTGRFIVNIALKYLRKGKLLGRHYTFIICDSEEEEQIISSIKQENQYIISGVLSAKSLDRYYRPGTLRKLHELKITEVFISWNAIKNRMFVCWLFQASGITVHILPMELKPIYRDVKFNKIGGMVCLSFDCPIITGKDFLIKRSFDFGFTIIFLILTFPIYILIAIAIKLDSPGSIFYKQTRIGLCGQPFKVWKFRTMRFDAEKLQKELEALNEIKDGVLFKIKDDPRITRVGKFLRHSSLDELPQLFNVLLGEMSLVGPRPLPTRDVEKFSDHHFIRHEVLPGVTGLWQVSGRSDILDFEHVIKLDLSYIENWSLWLDFEILLKTVSVVLKKEGAY